MTWVSVNDNLVREEQAVLSVKDRGLLYGDAFYTTLKVKNGIPLFLEHHLNRISDTCRRLEFDWQPLSSVLEKTLSDLIIKTNIKDCGIRLTISRGLNSQPPLFKCVNPSVFILTFGIRRPLRFMDVITVPEQRDCFRDLKLVNRVVHMLSLKKAHQAGAGEAIFVEHGKLVEATCYNLIACDDRGRLLTPPLEGKGVNGIARQILMERCKIDEVELAENINCPLFLINNTKGIVPVRRLNNRTLPSNSECLERLRKALRKSESDYVKSHLQSS